jgi:ADP-ribosylglycohydrolase
VFIDDLFPDRLDVLVQRLLESSRTTHASPQCLSACAYLGDDADTTGAVCGQLAGAWFGESGIPAEWRTALAGQDQIEPVLTRLVTWSGALS